MNVIVEGGAVPALIKHLQAPYTNEADRNPKPFEHEVEKGSAFALGLLAVKVTTSMFFSCLFLYLRFTCFSSIFSFEVSVPVQRSSIMLGSYLHFNSYAMVLVIYINLNREFST